MRLRLLALCLVLCAVCVVRVSAQVEPRTRITTYATPPATCTPGDVIFRTTTPVGLQQCTATNTWAVVATRATNQAIVSVARNGLVTDWHPAGFDPDVTTHLFVDATAQDWRPVTEVSNVDQSVGAAVVVHRIGDASVRFVASENGSAVTGSVEPMWSTDGVTTVDDGTVDRPIVWTPLGIYAGSWQAAHNFTMGHSILASGFIWLTVGGGVSGDTIPDFAASPNSDDFVSDGELMWLNIGAAVAWSPGTRRSHRVNTPAPNAGTSQFLTIPSAAVPGTDYVFVGDPTAHFGTTGALEPTWAAAVSGDGSRWLDGDILWTETTEVLNVEMVVITGLAAPTTGPRVLTILSSLSPETRYPEIVLEDQAEVVNDFGAYAESAVGNRINNSESTLMVGRQELITLVYLHGQWQPAYQATR